MSNKDEVVKLKRQVMEALKAKDGKLASQAAQSLFVLASDDAEVRFLMAQVYVMLGMHDMAISSCDATLSIEPGFHEARLLKGKTLLEMRRFYESLETLSPLVTSMPTSPLPDFLMGVLYVQTHHYEWAVKAFDTVLEKMPDFDEAKRLHEGIQSKISGAPVDNSCRGRNLHIVARGRLSQRMNILLCGLVVAGRMGYTPKLHWSVDDYCACAADELFDTTGIELSDMSLEAVYEQLPKEVAAMCSDDAAVDPGRESLRIKDYHYQVALFRALRDASHDVIYTGEIVSGMVESGSFYKTPLPISLKQSIVDEIDAFVSEQYIDEMAIGMNMRVTDDSLGDYQEKYLPLVEKSIFKRFFVCLDQPSDAFAESDNAVALPAEHYCAKRWEDKPWDHSETVDGVEQGNIIYDANATINELKNLMILARTDIQANGRSSFQFLAKLIKKMMAVQA